ncbi:MAG: 50S ribosomal protein L3 [Candidatus Pacebacteria bacterium]|nr:50S ribosomal protein L3 [Candidatus Paceibacterota bacterium]
METIKGVKIKMSQIFRDETVYPVSVIKVDKKEDLELLKEGEKVKVTGTTKGHGFQGVVKRWSFGGGPKTHGQKNRLRAPGSIGSTAPQRVIPGLKMAGRMGGKTQTIRNLKVISIDKENSLVSLLGSVPGKNRQKVKIKKI